MERIDETDRRLQDWVGNIARPAQAVLCPPGEMGDAQGVSLHLVELVVNPPLRGVHRPPLSLSLRFLITTWFKDPLKAHSLLGRIAFAALEEKEFDLEPQPIPLAAWLAFGVAPRPSLLLKVPLNKPRPEKSAPRVRGKMSVRFGAMRPLHGQVLGPGRVPIMAATVTLPSLRLSARTDYSGRFHFPAVPTEAALTEIQVNARGREVSLPLGAAAEDEPLLIELNEAQI